MGGFGGIGGGIGGGEGGGGLEGGDGGATRQSDDCQRVPGDGMPERRRPLVARGAQRHSSPWVISSPSQCRLPRIWKRILSEVLFRTHPGAESAASTWTVL